MAATERVREDIRERIPIEDIVGRVVTLKRAGRLYKGLCPFHNEKTPSFTVSPDRGTYHCFGCGQRGDIFTFVMATQNVDFPEALRRLAREAGVEVEEIDRSREADSAHARIYEMNAAAATYFQGMLAAAAGVRARDYLVHRRMTLATIERFGLGYAPDSRDALLARLRTAGYSDEEVVAAGLALAPEEGGPLRDRWRGRVIFPIRDVKGRIVGFGGRTMGDGQPKYLNSPATAVFDKSRVLYTIEHAVDAIRGGREAVVVEGYMDALRAHQEGFANVVATLGTAITEHQLRALARLAPRLVLALDADPAGQKAAVRAGLAALSTLRDAKSSTSLLTDSPRREKVQVYVATLPDGQDPDDAIAADPQVWRNAISTAVPLMDHYVALVDQGLDRSRPEWRQEAIDTLGPAIRQLDGEGIRQVYFERLAALTGIDIRFLRDEVFGATPTSPSRRFGGRRERPAQPTEAPTPADPVRTVEEHLAGLLAHYPSAELRHELAGYIPVTVTLRPLFAALLDGREPEPDQQELAEQLGERIAAGPVLQPHAVLAAARVGMTRLAQERTRRAIIDFGQIAADADLETAHELDRRALEMLAQKEQLTVRLQREQSEYWRRTT